MKNYSQHQSSLFLLLSLVACSNNKSTTSENKEQPKTEQSTSTSSIEQTKAKNSQYKEVTSLLKGRLNPGDTEAATISIENNITTPDNTEPHDNIKISLIGQTKELVARYKETRRSHPLAADGRILDGIKLERELFWLHSKT